MGWHCQNGGAYSRTSFYAIDNAKCTYDTLASLGWTFYPICALLGNMEYESGYNPWRWQGDTRIASTDSYHINNQTGHAYGLCQQDPAGKYINSTYAQMQYGYGPNFLDISGNVNDGYAQLRYIHMICADPNGGEWIPDAPAAQGLGLPFSDFIANTPNYTVAQLTRTFFGCYERGTWNSNRVLASEWWSAELANYAPVPPPGSDNSAAWFGLFHMLKKRKYTGAYDKRWWK